MLTPYMLRAKRALVVTPSQFVRHQIALDFAGLNILKHTGVFNQELVAPTIREMEHRVASNEQWEELADFDVVIGTPFTVSPAMAIIPPPPPDLFDLVLVDEAHHSPATTWRELLNAFPSAKRVLFTATPFRRDNQEIKGRIVYNYPLFRAYEDGIFGEIEYVSVDAEANDDIAIAKRVQDVFTQDKESGFDHRIMVRTSTKNRVKDLVKVYGDHTTLHLRPIHSGISSTTVFKDIDKFKTGEIDGIICVDMLGEGFDSPNLKIAAVHAPHKSLAVTLQFIGRFARTNAPNLGIAKFLAIPSEIQIEATQLYKDDAAWHEIIPHLLDTRVQGEARVRSALEKYRQTDDTDAALEDLSLYALTPNQHVKVFKVQGEYASPARVEMPLPYEAVYRQIDDDNNTDVWIAESKTVPRWMKSDTLTNRHYDLFIVYYSPQTQLLFISASCKSEELYNEVAKQFVGEHFERLTTDVLNRAFLDLEELQFFSVGLRKRLRNRSAESYRTYVGSNAQKGIRDADGRAYHQGHAFARAWQGDEIVTIGISSSSKIWSSAASQIPDFIAWCDMVGQRISRNRSVRTGTEWDNLPTGVKIGSFPANLLSADWNENSYKNQVKVSYVEAGEQNTCPITDFDITPVRESCTDSDLLPEV